MQKKKSGVKKCLEIMTIRGGGEGGGGVGRLMEKTILNFHFDYLNPPLTTLPYGEEGAWLRNGYFTGPFTATVAVKL